MASILTDRTKGWAAAVRASRSTWAQTQPETTAVEVRRFMRGCGINIPLTGGYTAGVARFVHTFQDCLILSGVDADGTRWDYGSQMLAADHLAGPATLEAMRRSAAAGYRAWQHLRWAEIAVRDPNGKAPTFLNPVIYTVRDVVRLFAALRTAKGGPLTVRSWYRSPRWNTIVGGATASQHLLGLAIDFDPHHRLDEATVRAAMRQLTGHNGGGVGVVERWTRSGGRWGRRVSIVGPAHADLRARWARWEYKTPA